MFALRPKRSSSTRNRIFSPSWLSRNIEIAAPSLICYCNIECELRSKKIELSLRISPHAMPPTSTRAIRVPSLACPLSSILLPSSIGINYEAVHPLTCCRRRLGRLSNSRHPSKSLLSRSRIQLFSTPYLPSWNKVHRIAT